MKTVVSAVAAALLLSCATPVLAQNYQAEYDANWGLRMIGVDKALAMGIDGRGVLVGVQDSGIDIFHPEFIGRLSPFSFDGLFGGPVLFDSDGHGTHVSGIIAANRDGQGMVGVASGASIVSLHIGYSDPANPDPLEWSAAARDTLRYGLANGVRLFNASWGRGGPYTSVSPAEIDLYRDYEILGFQEVVGAGGVMVFANGNSNFFGNVPVAFQPGLPYFFPELERGWLAVASVGRTGGLAYYSQQCSVARMWCLAAPGGDQWLDYEDGIYSSYPASDYEFLQGTSMAAPHVTGALAIAKQLYPNASFQQLRKLVLETATDIGAAGIDDIYGWGLLNVGNLVTTADASAGAIYAQQVYAHSAMLDRVMDAVAARSVQVDPARPYGWWIAPFAGFGSVDGVTSAQTATTTAGGVAGGIEFSPTPDLSLGIFVAGSAGGLRGKDGNSYTDTGLHGGATLSFDNKAFFADLTLGASGFFGSSHRGMAPGLAGTVMGNGMFDASANTADSAIWGGAQLGYHFALDAVEVSPYAFGRVVRQSLDGAIENSNGILGLEVAGTSFTTGEVGFGVELVGSPFALNTLEVTPSLDLAYGRRLGEFSRTASVLGNTSTSSAPIGQDVLHIKAALDFTPPGSMVDFRLGYGGSISSGANSHSVSLSLTGKF